MQEADLVALGYDWETARRILKLLSDTEQMNWYTSAAARRNCFPVTRVSPEYPSVLQRLGDERPGCLWAKGDVSLLTKPAVALVGSRDLRQDNEAFAAEVGRQAACQGFVLVSGNARGADKTAQQACLDAGGQVISVVADELQKHAYSEGILYLSEDGFDLPFSTPRALSRNRIIHALGTLTFVAQCGFYQGGTWDGTERNLRKNISPVCCYDDGSRAARELAQMGAVLIRLEELMDIPTLSRGNGGFFGG